MTRTAVIRMASDVMIDRRGSRYQFSYNYHLGVLEGSGENMMPISWFRSNPEVNELKVLSIKML